MKYMRWSVLTGLILWMAAVNATPQGALQLEQALSKPTIAVRACQGAAETATASITLQGEQTVTPVDIVIALDRSGSENLNQVKAAARTLISHLNADNGDRVALVSFADTARMEQGLSSDFSALERAIDALEAGRLTALGDGLLLATNELTQNGRSLANTGIVVLSDGGSTTGLDPLVQAERAGDFAVYFVGITAKVNRGALSELARRAGGNFFARASDASLVGVLKRLGRALLAQFVTVRETLPDALVYAPTDAGGQLPKVTLNPSNHTTELVWTFDTLLSGQVWKTQFAFSATQLGTFALNRDSELSYLDPQGVRVTQVLPNPEIAVNGTPPPQVSFTLQPASPKANQSIQFLDRSSAADGAITTWQWDFGDGTTSAEQNPTHIYSSIGRYTVSLAVTDAQNCVVRFEQSFRISEVVPGPEVNIVFDPNALAPGQAIAFSIVPQNGVQSCLWDFGDGATGDSCQISHSYARPGNYDLTLVVTFEDGRTLNLSRLVTLIAPEGAGPGPGPVTGRGTLPHAGILFGAEKLLAGQEVSISVDTDGPVQTCAWDFGDGSTSDQCELSHTFAAAGTYTVSLVLTFDDGRTLDVTRSVEVTASNERPTAEFSFTPPNQRVGLPVAFNGAPASDPDGSISAWSWDFGDDTTSDQPNPLHTYSAPGLYKVALIVTDNAGQASETTSKQVPIGLPVRAFADLSALKKGPAVPTWMEFYIDGGVVTDEELEDAARRFANRSFVQSTQYRLSEADLRSLTELHDLRLLVAQYQKPEEAEAAGYQKIGDYRPGVGQGYANPDLINQDKPPRFDRVPMLIYAHNDEGALELAGVRFVAFEASEAQLFGLDGWNKFMPPPRGAGGTPPQGGPKGVPGELFLLTVWIWRENPEGMFVPVNPTVQ